MGISWVPAHEMVGYWSVMRGGYASCIPQAREVHGTLPWQWDWTVKVWVIGEESLGPWSCGRTMPTHLLGLSLCDRFV